MSLFHRHKWGKWRLEPGFRRSAYGEQFDTMIQVRECEDCGKVQLA